MADPSREELIPARLPSGARIVDAGARMGGAVEARGLRGALAGRAIVLASADVHVYGKTVVRAAFEAAEAPADGGFEAE